MEHFVGRRLGVCASCEGPRAAIQGLALYSQGCPLFAEPCAHFGTRVHPPRRLWQRPLAGEPRPRMGGRGTALGTAPMDPWIPQAAQPTARPGTACWSSIDTGTLRMVPRSRRAPEWPLFRSQGTLICVRVVVLPDGRHNRKRSGSQPGPTCMTDKDCVPLWPVPPVAVEECLQMTDGCASLWLLDGGGFTYLEAAVTSLAVSRYSRGARSAGAYKCQPVSALKMTRETLTMVPWQCNVQMRMLALWAGVQHALRPCWDEVQTHLRYMSIGSPGSGTGAANRRHCSSEAGRTRGVRVVLERMAKSGGVLTRWQLGLPVVPVRWKDLPAGLEYQTHAPSVT